MPPFSRKLFGSGDDFQWDTRSHEKLSLPVERLGFLYRLRQRISRSPHFWYDFNVAAVLSTQERNSCKRATENSNENLLVQSFQGK